MSVMTEAVRPLGPPKLGVNGLDICNRELGSRSGGNQPREPQGGWESPWQAEADDELR